MSSHRTNHRQESDDFPGFAPLTANYIYCPNQFFEVCLPNSSRGAVRIVAYLLRETLGWLDEEGNPQRQNIVVSYTDLIRKAGVSRGAIGKSLREAIDGGFICCQQKGIAGSAGITAKASTFSLRWNQGGEYTRDLAKFAGFFAGEGHRTPVPNQFFDDVIRHHPLSVAKVVGTVIRNTVGYQNQFGCRRSSAPLSQQYIAKFSGLSLGKAVSEAIQFAEQAGFIQRLEAGCFSHNRNEQEAVRYGVRWSSGSKFPAGDQFKNSSSSSSKSPAEKRYKNPSTLKTKKKDNNKQQRNAASSESLIEMLVHEGIDQHVAKRLIDKRGVEIARQQIEWLDARSPENRAAMLIKAIDENWSQPKQLIERERRDQLRQRDREHNEKLNQEAVEIEKQKQARAQRKQVLLARWNEASTAERKIWIQAALECETSKMIAERIRRESPETDAPHVQVLDVVADEYLLPRVVQINSTS